MTKKNIVITGGSSGIGREIAQLLTGTSVPEYKVVIIGRSEEKLKLVQEEINGTLNSKGECHFISGDTSSDTDVERMFANTMVILEGRIDGIILNAGVGKFGLCEDLTVADFDITFGTNVRGVFLWLRLVVPCMKRQECGQIIVTSSNLGVKTASRCCLYSASKFAVQSMVGCLRAELVGTGVKAATINPGSVDTPWFDGRDVDRTKMLQALDVAVAAKLILEQGATSDIDMILLNPGKQ